MQHNGTGNSPAAGTSPPAADRRRWGVLTLLFFSITINLLDRQVLSVLAPVIRDELRLSNTQYSYIVASFLLGMTLAQVPAGMLMDRWGARIGLTVLMLWWSAANGLHAIAKTTAALCGFRFLMGIGECGNYSGGIKVISQWFPQRERALAGGIFNSGTVIGAFVAPPLIVAISAAFGWRMTFVVPSAVGLLWLVPWLLFYRDRHTVVKAADAIPLARLVRLREVWAVLLMRAFSGPVLHFYWYWLPEYLKRERHLSMDAIAWLAGVPFLFAGMGNIVGGWFSGFLLGRGWSANAARKLSFGLSAVLCACSALVPVAPGEVLPIVAICVAILGISSFVATHIGTLTDLFPGAVLARVAGVTGVGEGIVNLGVTLATGIVVDRYSYVPVFVAASIMPLLGTLACLVLIRRIAPIPAERLAGVA